MAVAGGIGASVGNTGSINFDRDRKFTDRRSEKKVVLRYSESATNRMLDTSCLLYVFLFKRTWLYDLVPLLFILRCWRNRFHG